MSSDCYILVPWKCPRKTPFQHTVKGGGGIFRLGMLAWAQCTIRRCVGGSRFTVPCIINMGKGLLVILSGDSVGD